jgi:aldose sugar dehydrogenase
MKQYKIVIATIITLIAIITAIALKPDRQDQSNVTTSSSMDYAPSSEQTARKNYQNYCASCHGEQLQSFVDRKWQFGNSRTEIRDVIKNGENNAGMPAYGAAFSEKELNELTDLIMGVIENDPELDFKQNMKPKETIASEEMDYSLEMVVDGLESPWGMAFLPNNEILVTDKYGTLYKVVPSKSKTKITGVPEVQSGGQGGLMDIELHPGFETNNIIYLSYSKIKDGNGLSTTAVLKARLQENQLTDQEIIFEALPYLPTRHHYGSRLEFDNDGHLYLSVGDRGRRDENPQSLDNHCGKIHRINDDGSIPEDNPFVGNQGAKASIFSYGHRNPQGVVKHPETGLIWTHEHGPRGGDEINIVEKGKNYGWPVISYGINYNGTVFTDITHKEGMEQPILYWVPSIAPCGMDFVTGDRYPAWKGNLLVGSLRFKYLERCVVENNKVVHQEKLLKNIGRVRNVKMGLDGFIYVAVEEPGVVYRVVPK